MRMRVLKDFLRVENENETLKLNCNKFQLISFRFGRTKRTTIMRCVRVDYERIKKDKLFDNLFDWLDQYVQRRSFEV